MLRARYGGSDVEVRALRPTKSYGHTETGPRFKVSSGRPDKSGIELTIPGL